MTKLFWAKGLRRLTDAVNAKQINGLYNSLILSVLVLVLVMQVGISAPCAPQAKWLTLLRQGNPYEINESQDFIPTWIPLIATLLLGPRGQ